MGNKVKKLTSTNGVDVAYVFYCPGCKNEHPFTVVSKNGSPQWFFNGDLEKPTFTPSLVCSPHDPENRCHLFVTGGHIQFLIDCHHDLRGCIVAMQDYEQ